MKILSSIAFLLFVGFQVNGQEKSEVIQQRIEFISEQLETEELDLTNVIEALNYYFDHPINLNGTDGKDLEELGLLSEVQINDLLLHRKQFGKLISIYEIQALRYWDMQSILLVLPFVRVDDKLDNLSVSLKEALRQGKFESFFRYQRVLEEKNAYQDVSDSILQNSNSYYYGNPDHYYTRLRFSYRTNLSVGVTADKDPGEEFFKGSQKQGFDFYSVHAFYKGGKYLRAVALGDYQLQVGQGLNIWSGYAFAKTADATNVKKNANALRPYTSVDETRFLRGAAIDLGFKDFSWLLFGSVKRVDAGISVDSLLDDFEFASTINLTGLHRTNSEIARKDGLQERIFGTNLRYDKGAFHAGVAGVYWGYDKNYVKTIQPYNQFDFRGQSMMSFSGDYSWTKRNFNIFGETSYSEYSKSFAHIHGAMVSLDPNVALSVVYRNYDRAYQTVYNNGFAEGSQTQNEEGFYAGLRVKLSKSFSVNSYYDLFRFPWMKYLVDAPSNGHEFLIQPTYKPNRELEIYARYREQLRQRNSRNQDATVTEIEDVLQRNYRLNISYKVNEAVTLKSRVEYVTIARKSSAPEDGIIFTQDILFKPKTLPFDIALRYALFDTDSYDTRIYTFENNALYVFSSPSYYYQGSRTYALIRYSFLRRFDLWVRYGVSLYVNRDSLGSGAEQINQPRKSDLTIQLRMSL